MRSKHDSLAPFFQCVIAVMRGGCIKNDTYDEYWSIRYADFLPRNMVESNVKEADAPDFALLLSERAERRRKCACAKRN